MTMSDLKNLFHKPAHQAIGGTAFIVSKIAFEHFDDAMTLGRWVAEMDESLFAPEQLASIKTGSPERQALNRLLAGCLAVAQLPEIDQQAPTQREWPIQLKPADVDAMPLMMVAEAVAVVLEVNADFFSRPCRGCWRRRPGSGRLVRHCSAVGRRRPPARAHKAVQPG